MKVSEVVKSVLQCAANKAAKRRYADGIVQGIVCKIKGLGCPKG